MTYEPDEWVGVTEHAAERWLDRADDDFDGGPRTAWFDGFLVDEPHGLEADEVRLHEPSGTVLVRKDVDLVTVIDVENMKPELASAVRATRQVIQLTTDTTGVEV